MKPWLLIDNSNSRTKFGLGDENGLLEWRAVLDTAEISDASLNDLLLEVDFSSVTIGSVVPLKRQVFANYFSGRWPVHFLDARSPLGLGIDYPLPEQIGADRLANAAGLLGRHRTPAIVIDFGTAVTFDVVSAQPAYCGGAIAPGLGAMAGYLSLKTALLPLIEILEPASAIGKSTVHAMQVGAVIGYRGLVKEILSSIVAEMAGDPLVIATGGDAALIAKGVPEIHLVDQDITLHGLRHVAANVFC